MSNNKKSIGMLVAIQKEIKAILNRHGESAGESTFIESKESGYTVLKGEIDDINIYVISSGEGEISAAAATQYLITKYNVDMIVNFGIVGGLTEEMAKAKTCVVEKVVHYDYDASAVDDCDIGKYPDYPSIYLQTTESLVQKATELYPNLKKVICASGDKFVADPDKKRELNKIFKADICEMEAAGIVLTCNRNNVPCLLIKTVSDGITGGAEEYQNEKEKSAEICFDITEELIKQL